MPKNYLNEKVEKVTKYKTFTVYLNVETQIYYIYTKDEMENGIQFAYPEMESGSINEAKQFIDCYGE